MGGSYSLVRLGALGRSPAQGDRSLPRAACVQVASFIYLVASNRLMQNGIETAVANAGVGPR